MKWCGFLLLSSVSNKLTPLISNLLSRIWGHAEAAPPTPSTGEGRPRPRLMPRRHLPPRPLLPRRRPPRRRRLMWPRC